MNSSYFYAVISCLFVVTAQQISAKFSQPPMKKTHPDFWSKDLNGREFKLQSKNIWYIQIEKHGRVSGSKTGREAAVIRMRNGENGTVLLQGKDSKWYLCMSNDSRVYSKEDPNDTDCRFKEEYENFYNTYYHFFHRRGDRKYYLSINNEGTVRVGSPDDSEQIYFTPIDATIKPPPSNAVTTTTTDNPVQTVKLPTSTVPPIKRKLEKTRKRRRRWCKLLIIGRLENNPDKYRDRCKHDCNILKTMLDNPKRYKRKCEKQRQRRRRRNRKKYSRDHGPNHRKRHHHGQKSKRTRKNRGWGRERKRTSVRSSASSQTHNTDVT